MGDGRHNSNHGLELDLEEAFGPESGLRPQEPEPSARPDATRVARVDRALLAAEKKKSNDDAMTCAPVSDLGEDPRIAAMRELYASGDAEGALFVASALQPNSDPGEDVHPADLDEHTSVSDSGVKLASLASLTGVPRLMVSAGEVSALPLDHRSGFLLAHVDGSSTMEDILDICAMTESEALGIMKNLVSLGVISFE
jgi:hypothetical protein